VVTSQYAIEQIWAKDLETRNALRRRFKVIELKQDLDIESIGDADDILLVTKEVLDVWNKKIRAEEMGELKEELEDKSLKSLLELPGREAAAHSGETAETDIEQLDSAEDKEKEEDN